MKYMVKSATSLNKVADIACLNVIKAAQPSTQFSGQWIESGVKQRSENGNFLSF